MLISSVTVDGCAITGNETDIKWFMDNGEKHLNITREGEISKHLGVIYEWGETENGKCIAKRPWIKRSHKLFNHMNNILAKIQKPSVFQELQMKT